jgi:hypothetical protein
VEEKVIEAELERRRQQRDRNAQALVELLDRRSELRGVYPFADQVIEAIAWSA